VCPSTPLIAKQSQHGDLEKSPLSGVLDFFLRSSAFLVIAIVLNHADDIRPQRPRAPRR
jgi:hypothetical protein